MANQLADLKQETVRRLRNKLKSLVEEYDQLKAPSSDDPTIVALSREYLSAWEERRRRFRVVK